MDSKEETTTQHDAIYTMDIDEWSRALYSWNGDHDLNHDADWITQFDAYCGIEAVYYLSDNQEPSEFKFKIVDRYKFMRMMLLWGVRCKIA
jgi:hypothetical protein